MEVEGRPSPVAPKIRQLDPQERSSVFWLPFAQNVLHCPWLMWQSKPHLYRLLGDSYPPMEWPDIIRSSFGYYGFDPERY